MKFLLLVVAFSAHAAALDGTWLQGCAHGYQREENFLCNSATYTERNFWDHDCKQPALETISRGIVSLGEGVDQPLGARQIDFVFTSVSLKPRDLTTAKTYRDRILCGFRDWSANEEKEITGRECDFFGLGSVVKIPAKGTRKYGVVKIAADALYFGRLTPARDSSAPERRPLELDPAPYRLAP